MIKKSIYMAVLVLFSACHRKEYKVYLGDYDCSLFTFYQTPGEPNEYILSTGYEVTVVKDGKYIAVLGQKIHIDDIEPAIPYQSAYGILGDSIYFTISFRNDSIYHETIRKEGDLITTTTYFGRKIN